MEIDPVRVADHLSKIHFRDIETIVLRDRFACVADNPDHTLTVAAPALEGVEPLPEEIGVVVKTFIGSLRLPMFREWREKTWIGLSTTLTVMPDAVVLARPDVTIKLRRVVPKAVESRVDPATAEELLRSASEVPGLPLSIPTQQEWAVKHQRKYFKEVPRAPLTPDVTFAALVAGAEKVILEVGPNGGQFVVPGMEADGRKAQWLITIPHDLRTENPYELTFEKGPLLDVFSKLQGAKPRIHLAGPRARVLFTTEEGFQYLLKPGEALRALNSP